MRTLTEREIKQFAEWYPGVELPTHAEKEIGLPEAYYSVSKCDYVGRLVTVNGRERRGNAILVGSPWFNAGYNAVQPGTTLEHEIHCALYDYYGYPRKHDIPFNRDDFIRGWEEGAQGWPQY